MFETEFLKKRDQRVLHAIISEYIISASAVGSRTITKKYIDDLSPATVRNVMADLEENGYLFQPHTSAGRVPTEKGFRFYINSLLEKTSLTQEEEETIRTRSQESAGDRKKLLREISRLLSIFSNNIGVVSAPRFKETIFKRIQFIRLNPQAVLGVFVSELGDVQNRILTVEKEISQSECDRMSNYLNDILQGLPLKAVKEKIIGQMREEKTLYDKLLSKALKMSQAILEEQRENEVYVEGQTHLLEQPEFAQDVEKMRSIFHAFEEKGILVELLDQSIAGEEANIYFGSEMAQEGIEGCSFVIAPYHGSGAALGKLGVIGPIRMNYSKVVPLVEYTARLMTRLLHP